MKKMKVGNYTIEISNPEKLIFPKSKISKLEFIEYYQKIAHSMLPYLKNRPVTMLRFPDGIGKKGFYHKDTPSYFPSYIKRVSVPKKEGGIVHYAICNNAASLVYLASQLTITPHLWLSTTPKLTHPDRIIFDLDPSAGVDFALIGWAAKELKKLLDQLDLPAFIMTTGSRGVHIVIPIKRLHTFEYTRAFARDIAQLLAHWHSKKLTIEISKKKRGKRIFIDYLRNSFGATGVAPYGVRALEGAPVATPFDWDELGSITPQKYTIRTIFKRLSRKKDPWASMAKKTCSIKKARKKLDQMLDEIE